MGLIGYGIPALSGGVLSGLFPVPLGLRAPAGAQLNKAAPNTQMQIKLKSAGQVGRGQVSGARNVARSPAAARAGSQAVSQTGTFPLRK